jgi:uncharacterized protein YuzE
MSDPRWTYDAEVEMGYIHLSSEGIVQTKELYPGVLVDLDAQGDVVGVEVFCG